MNVYFIFIVFSCVFFSCLSISSAFISCGSDIYLQAGTFSVNLVSPGHPSYYPSGTCKKWRITAPSGKLVQLKFISFDLYGYPTCSKSSDDTLKIYDSFSSSNLIGKYCGKYIPANVVSSGRYLYLVFYSNSKIFSADRGFKLVYNAISDPGTDSSICSPFNSVYTNKNIRLTASSTRKYIQSPLYPARYPSNIECVWYITASSSSKKIKLTVTNQKIYNYAMFSCSSASDYDFLKVKDGSSLSSSLLKEMCSTSYSSSSVTSSGRYMTVQFKTNLDNYYNGATTGFKAEFVELDNTSDSTGVIVGAIIAVIIVVVILIPCCICIVKRQRTSGQVVRHPPVTTATTTTTTTQYPMQPQAPVPPQGTYPQAGVSYPPPPAGGYPPVPPASNYPPPGSSYPPPGSSYPPPGSNYPPAVQGSYPPPSDPPPQYPGPPGYPPQPSYNPQMASQPNPPYPPAAQGSTNQQFQYPPPVDTKASAPPAF